MPSHRGTWLTVALLTLGASRVPAQTSTAHGTTGAPRTADDVIARNVEARGGAARLASVNTAHLLGHIAFDGGAPGPFSVEMKRPGRVRTELRLTNGQTIVQGYDGQVAWMTTGTDSTARVLPKGEADNVAAGGDLDGPLVNHDAKGNHVALAGIDTALGRPAYRIDVTTASGLHDTYFIDTTTHLQTKWQGARVMGGQPVTFESLFSDYQPTDGVMFAHRIESHALGHPGGQVITLDSVQVNEPERDDRFRMPGAPRHD